MENDRETEVPSVSSLQFNETEERQIAVMAEAFRRAQGFTPLSEPTDEQLIAVEGKLIGAYLPRRRHFLSFVVETWRRIGGGLLTILILWILISFVPAVYFDIQAGSQQSLLVGLIAVGITFVIVVVVFLLELQSFMRWSNWKLEVTSNEVIIGQSRSFIGRLDENSQSLRRRSVEYVQVERKWYLWFIDAWTVSFDTPTGEDQDFHDLRFIKDGKLLKALFDHRKG